MESIGYKSGGRPQVGKAEQLVVLSPDGRWRRLMYIQGQGTAAGGKWFDLRTFQSVPDSQVFENGSVCFFLSDRGGPRKAT